jgi:hypothetical protein
MVDVVRQLALISAKVVVPVRRARLPSVSPRRTEYAIQPAGLTQTVATGAASVGRAVDVGLGVGVGVDVGVGVGEAVTSAVGLGEVGGAVGVGDTGVALGSGVGEGCSPATACVGEGGIAGASRRLSRNPPSSIPTLTRVTTKPTSNCLTPSFSPVLACVCWLKLLLDPPESRSRLGQGRIPGIGAG